MKGIKPKRVCVYCHFKDGVLFYIGKGTPTGDFDMALASRNSIWRAVYGSGENFHIDIVEWFDSDADALALEGKLIRDHMPPANIGISKDKNGGKWNGGDLTLNLGRDTDKKILSESVRMNISAKHFICNAVDFYISDREVKAMNSKNMIAAAAEGLGMSVSEFIKLGE